MRKTDRLENINSKTLVFLLNIHSNMKIQRSLSQIAYNDDTTLEKQILLRKLQIGNISEAHLYSFDLTWWI